MKQTLFCTLALTSCVSTLWAAPITAPGGDEWATLDHDIEALSATSTQDESGGPTVKGLLKTAWISAPNLLSPSQDISGFSLVNAQVELNGHVGDRSEYRVQLEAAGGNAQILDAYGAWRWDEHLRVTLGNFRAPLMWESQLADGDMLYLLRTDSAALFYSRDEGAMVDGSWKRLHWAASLQNGFDNQAGEQAACGRLGVDVIGEGVGLHQGAYGEDGAMSLTVGGGVYSDSGISKEGSVYTADAQFRLERFAAEGSFTKYGNGNDGANRIFATRHDSQAWAASASFMAIENLVEVAARYQDTDNDQNARDITLGVNYYMKGHAAKLQVDATRIFSDDPTVEDTYRAGIGVNVSI